MRNNSDRIERRAKKKKQMASRRAENSKIGLATKKPLPKKTPPKKGLLY